VASSRLFGGKPQSFRTRLNNTRSLARTFSLIVQSMLTFFRRALAQSSEGSYSQPAAGKPVCAKDSQLALPRLILRPLFLDVNAPCRPET
jgi:hypothetical protein